MVDGRLIEGLVGVGAGAGDTGSEERKEGVLLYGRDWVRRKREEEDEKMWVRQREQSMVAELFFASFA